jgi:hypothetical protein
MPVLAPIGSLTWIIRSLDVPLRGAGCALWTRGPTLARPACGGAAFAETVRAGLVIAGAALTAPPGAATLNERPRAELGGNPH